MASRSWGGLEKVFVDLCNTIGEKHEVHVIVFADSYVRDYLSQNLHIHLLKANPTRLNPALYFELRKMLRRINPDIIHTHGAKSSELIHRLHMKTPHIATKHSVSNGRIFNKLRFVTAVSKETLATVKNEKISQVIYNGIDPVEILPSEQTSFVPFRILAVGRLDKIKGFDILIEECAKLRFDFHLEIVGDGPHRDILEHLIDTLGMGEKIAVKGFCSDVPQRMQDANLIVVSSHSEGFGLIVLEAMFYGKMVLSTPVGIAKEILPDEFLTTHHTLAKKIEEMYADSSYFQKRFRDFALMRKNDFLLESVSEKYLSFYEQIVDPKEIIHDDDKVVN